MNIQDIEDILCDQAINEICVSGCNDEAVKKWTNYHLKEIMESKPTFLDFFNIQDGYGFENPKNAFECIERSVWIAAWNRFDSDMFLEFIENVEV